MFLRFSDPGFIVRGLGCRVQGLRLRMNLSWGERLGLLVLSLGFGV
jgi:hypothetical protein